MEKRLLVKNRFEHISMNGRMAYVIMCIEAFLQGKYPDRDWSVVSEAMWKATEMNWGDWPNLYSGFIPSVLFTYANYGFDLPSSFPEETFHLLHRLYDDITAGAEDDPSDEVNYMLNKPFEIAMVYEGTGIGESYECFEIMEEAEAVLIKNKIPLPDYGKVRFSSVGQCRGWGESFDGRFLSIILCNSK